ncbi:hypothetical protein [Actinocorallia longicatena]|uniref:Uncharacterized protein n=1 Tax=Actinocorallia longicatena TaxID=111803 RepID=A0ABP6QEH3_9ACTN
MAHLTDTAVAELQPRLEQTGLTRRAAARVAASIAALGVDSPDLHYLEPVARRMSPTVRRVLDTFHATTWPALAVTALPALDHRLTHAAKQRAACPCTDPRRCQRCHPAGNPPAAPAWAAEHRRRTRRRRAR